MPVSYRTSCISEVARFSNEQFTALMAAMVGHREGSIRKLFLAAAPLLAAFYEGQVQAKRAKVKDLEYLVQQALIAIYRGRSSYCLCQPFRAWLLDMARLQMIDYQRNGSGDSVMRAAGDTKLGCAVGIAPFEQVHVVRVAQIALRVCLNSKPSGDERVGYQNACV